jgi:hypothetical protein
MLSQWKWSSIEGDVYLVFFVLLNEGDGFLHTFHIR